MDSVPGIVTHAAVWGSLIANVLLGTFMVVQAVMDPPRRSRYAAFAGLCFAIVVVDSLQPRLPPATWELLRLVAWSGYGVAILNLLGTGRRGLATAAVGLPLIGGIVWMRGLPALASTVAFPVIFAVAAVAHGRQYLRTRGYSSGVLTAVSWAMALTCTSYYSALVSGDSRIISLGFGHWFFLTALSVLFGWIHLPRELRGRAPVTMPRRQALALAICMVAGEAAVVLSLTEFFLWPPILYLGASVFMLACVLVVFFYHRHQLVIHADNIGELLEQRTASLRLAREELSRQNEIQAQKLAEQEHELKTKAQVIERQRRLELAAQTTGQAAHDIQNIISPILSHVARLEQRGGSLDAVQEVASTIRRQVEHLMELNGQMLALTRRGRMDQQPVDLKELLDDLTGRFPGGRLTIEAPREAWVRASWSQLMRAISNLVVNALEVSSASAAPVTVRLRRAEIAGHQRCHLGFLAPGQYAVIDVEDRGPGIPDAILDRIFEPFFSSKSGRHQSGSGLGLSIVAAVMDDHRGVVDLRTGTEGTCFSLYLPLIEVALQVSRDEQLSGSETVIVADDDTSVLNQVAGVLEAAGYKVSRVESGVQVLEQLQTGKADLLLLDLKMPRLTGLDTFFAAMHLQAGIPAIIHSSYVTEDEARRLGQLGISCILQKPASRLELLRSVRLALDEKAPSTQRMSTT